MTKSLRSISRKLVPVARRLLALTLVLAIAPTAPLLAQVAAVAQSTATAPMSLHITILDGEDALNNIRERTAREPIVQVEDENHKPVAGALILFSIQNGGSGAGGSFGGASTLSVTTDADGRAVAHGLKPNQTSGSYTIGVSATLGTLVAMAVIHQQNIVGGGGGGATPSEPGTPATPATPGAPATPGSPAGPVSETPIPSGPGPSIKHVSKIHLIPKKVWIVGGTIVTVGVVVGVVVATRGSSSTTITAGTGTVGP